MEDNEIIICSNCYEENKKGATNCKNCGERLFYNDMEELQKYKGKELEYFDDEMFNNYLKFNRSILAVDKENRKVCFFFDEVLERSIAFENIVECQIIKDSKVMEEGGVGRALVGGILAGRSWCNSWSDNKKK